MKECDGTGFEKSNRQLIKKIKKIIYDTRKIQQAGFKKFRQSRG